MHHFTHHCHERTNGMRTFNSTVSVDRINELLSYDPSTGVFTWKVQRNNRVKAGSVAGTVSKFGHRALRVDHSYVLEHRAAWAVTYGVWPKMDIDHINGNPSDNRISNLRHVSRSTNLQNQTMAHKDSRSGYLGVTARGLRWSASIYHLGKRIDLGVFNTPEEASEAYFKSKNMLHAGSVPGKSIMRDASHTPTLHRNANAVQSINTKKYKFALSESLHKKVVAMGAEWVRLTLSDALLKSAQYPAS